MSENTALTPESSKCSSEDKQPYIMKTYEQAIDQQDAAESV